MDAAPDFRALRRVPAAVEATWLFQARAALGVSTDEQALERLIPVVERLSDGFTCERAARMADYGADGVERAAYALCFGAQSWVRARLALADAAAVRGWRPRPGAAPRILDVGAGGGAAGLSLATWLAAEHALPRARLVALDRSSGALAGLADLERRALPLALAPETTVLVGDALRPSDLGAAAAGPFDLIVVSFALNELFPGTEDARAEGWLATLAERLTPDGLLLLLEPAPKPFAARVRRLAAASVERMGLQAWAPQLVSGAWKPAEDARTWPHEARRWELPASLARMNQRLWRSLAEVTFSCALLGRAVPPPLPSARTLWRMASPVRRLRGRLGWLGYAADGALVEYEVQERDLAAVERGALLDLERGDLLEARALRALPHGVERLLGPAPLVRVVRPEGATRFNEA